MEDISENKQKKHICVGILAHVDAGKTTLSESMLYLSGKIRELGRVDHKNAYLDTYELERNRGITIFSKQAVFELGDKKVTLLDTPGHVDFSAEMERTLQVLDYAILVISGMDGVQGHTRTLWNLLRRYRIPVFLFINKMDQEGTDRERLLRELKISLDEGCIAFDEDESVLFENLAMCEDAALDEYLQSGELCVETMIRLIEKRKAYPCYFGSALKLQGVQEFMAGLRKYTVQKAGCKLAKHPKGATEDRFGAKVYKISRDAQGNRLTHLKVTSGALKVKDILANEADAEEHWEEKVNQIRIYSGEKYETVQEAEMGSICAVTGLNYTYPGEGLGVEKESQAPVLEPVLNYRIGLPEGCDAHTMLRNLRQLEEEDPMLRIVWNEELGEIYAQIMGEVQIEILQSLIQERFHVAVTFDTGNIVYKETIKNTVEGVGHFEPLRHYAEVHLLLEPGKPGSGLVLDTDCSEDMLDKNWQRLILTHLAEKEHRGVLTGAHLTDVKITLTAGRAHLKHTEGGDFRQATYRAVRQGLMQAENVLLEPYYEYRLELPSEMVGRAMIDIQKMSGEFEPPETDGEISILTGSVPVATMRDYQMEVNSYTRGRGRLSCTFKGYEPCHNAEEVIEASGYDPQRDLDNPTGSVFCSHGAGFVVPWDQVLEYMHIESQLQKESETEYTEQGDMLAARAKALAQKRNIQPSLSYKEEKELEEIFIRTYGKIERRLSPASKTVNGETKRRAQKKEEPVQEYLLVDGYNVIFAWDDLKELAQDNIEAARNKLMDILSNYQGFKKCIVILVFDAYKVDGYALEIQKYHNIHVVYTKEAETADQYIEKVVHHIGKKYHVTVVTSDGVEQVVTLGQGGTLISSREFREEYEIVRRQIREEYESRRETGKNYLFDHMDEKLAEEMEDVRLGRKKRIGNN
ncbi:NYN domain-containing protein [Bariatricus sp. SGI.154]|uniref:NYN domain-containing protein n=1 Tax=Bariatricus sp. SGI.154 TaxID=3420549 RepID=UPI003D08861B